jgi:hypothetical protein
MLGNMNKVQKWGGLRGPTDTYQSQSSKWHMYIKKKPEIEQEANWNISITDSNKYCEYRITINTFLRVRH